MKMYPIKACAVDTLEEAIELQNAPDYGLTAGLHSLDAEELELWLSKVQAGNVYVNRGITGAIVRRQPFGGWKKSAFGDLNQYGADAFRFYTKTKTVTSRWFSGIKDGASLNFKALD